ncbi:MAG: hypothetical protein P8008_03090 [Gammaproteobacteria bacterium]
MKTASSEQIFLVSLWRFAPTAKQEEFLGRFFHCWRDENRILGTDFFGFALALS